MKKRFVAGISALSFVALASVAFLQTVSVVNAVGFEMGAKMTTEAFDPEASAKTLIANLNREVDRIDQNNSWEEVDGITNPAVDMILSAMNLRNIEWMSEIELDTYLASRFEIIDRLDRYMCTLPEWDRKLFFQNAEEYMRDLMIAD